MLNIGGGPVLNIDTIKILGSLLNSGALAKGSGSNILSSVIGALAGGGNQPQSGGLGGLLGSMLGGGRQAQTQGGGLGGVAGGGQSSGGSLGDLLGMAMKQFGQATGAGSPQQAQFDTRYTQPQAAEYEELSDKATVLIRAMINAAKADGHVDREEQKKIVEKLGEVSQEEIEFVRTELAEPLDVERFVQSIPRGMEQQVYAVSLMAIDLDTNPEAQYLHQLAQGTGISPQVCNQIHKQLGVPQIYS